MLTSAHKPLIEGLGHGSRVTTAGSVAATQRKKFTDFGSGWRGILSVPENIWARYFSNAAALLDHGAIRTRSLPTVLRMARSGKPITNASARRLEPFIQKIFDTTSVAQGLEQLRLIESQFMPGSKQFAPLRVGRVELNRFSRDLHDARVWSKRTGFDPVLVGKQYFGSADKTYLQDVLRHERIHQAHLVPKNEGHPFFSQALAEAPPLDPKTEEFYTAINSESDLKTVLESEKLAYGFQKDRSFFRRAKTAGVPLPTYRNPWVDPISSVSNEMRASAGTDTSTSLRRLMRRPAGSRDMSRAI